MRYRLTEVPESDVAAMNAELQRAGLPVVDPSQEQCGLFCLRGDDDRVVAYAGLQGDGGDVLLRSVVVLPEFRAGGVATYLLKAVSAKAAQLGALRLWLLTTTAESFFARCGFKKMDRSAAPGAIASTSEFANICPASAVCMSKALVA